MRKTRAYNRRSAKQLATLEQLQDRYPFKQNLQYYLMGVSGKPEAQEQKAFYQCLCGEFGEVLGRYDLTTATGITETIYPALIVATSDFYDRHGKRMKQYRHMGYQPGTPDMMILVPRGGYHGLVIEMKSARGTATTGQRRTLAFLRTQGFACHVCKGYAETVKTWLDYLERDTEIPKP